MFGYIYKFIKFSKNQRKNMILSLVFGFFKSVFNAASILSSAYVLNKIIDNEVSNKTIYISLGIILVGILGGFICSYFGTQMQTIAGYTTAANARIRIAERLKYTPMGYFNEHNLGQITKTATNSATILQETLTRCMLLSVQGLLTTIVINIAMFIFDWRIGMITLAGLILFLIVNKFLHKAGDSLSIKRSDSIENAVESVLEYVQGISEIKSYNLVGDSNEKVRNAIKQENELSFKMEKAYIPFMSLQNLVTKLTSIVIVLAAVIFTIDGSMELGNTLMVAISSFMIYEELAQGGNMSALLRSASISIDEINNAMNMPSMNDGGKTIRPTSSKITVKNVDFSYDKKKILNNINLEIKPKSTLAIVGGSGSGKTTLCNLLIRFWDPDKGVISLGDNDIKEYTLDSLLKNYSMVFQNVYLFNDTIANNIRFGKPNATIEEIREAAKKACCDEFIMELPNGYDTIIGEGGASISGGEKQRISIARAIIKDSPIIILDEATANVDPENEYLLQRAIKELTKEKTVIMIAHRLKTVRNADKIIVIENGQIVEEGSHDDLIKLNKAYAGFINMKEQAVGWKLGRK